jgi:hypothetical protein
MVKRDGIDDTELSEVVFIRDIVTMPGYNIEGGIVGRGNK